MIKNDKSIEKWKKYKSIENCKNDKLIKKQKKIQINRKLQK